MSLTRKDWAEIFNHLRTEVQKFGFRDLDTDIFESFRGSIEPKENVLAYLEKLTWRLNTRSLSSYNRTMNKFSESVQTEDKQPISGVEIRVEDKDATLFNQKVIELDRIEDYSALHRALEDFRAELETIETLDE